MKKAKRSFFLTLCRKKLAKVGTDQFSYYDMNVY